MATPEQLEQLIERRRFLEVRRLLEELSPESSAWLIERLSPANQAISFRLLPRQLAAQVFEYLPLSSQEPLLYALGDTRVAQVLDDMAPDDRTQLLEELPGVVTRRLMNLLSAGERQVASRLLGYPEESIGRLMTPDYVAVKPSWSIAEALDHIRQFGRDAETLNVVYVTASGGRLVADIRIRELLLVPLETKIETLMKPGFVALEAMDDQEVAVQVFRRTDRSALPVIDGEGILVGMVTVDDILDVADQEATEDIHRLVGSESLDQPYLQVTLRDMVMKRSVWLVLLFFGQMLTATAMGRFEAELAQAMVLALFVPLIISSGGNSGSQAAAIIIRALTLGEVIGRDWLRVLGRELLTGATIGAILGIFGFLRVLVVEQLNGSYGEHWPLIGITIALSVFGVVLWGTAMGALLPFGLKRLGMDPATSSTPAVATLVDVTGILIYFTVAQAVLRGTLL